MLLSINFLKNMKLEKRIIKISNEFGVALLALIGISILMFINGQIPSLF